MPHTRPTRSYGHYRLICSPEKPGTDYVHGTVHALGFHLASYERTYIHKIKIFILCIIILIRGWRICLFPKEFEGAGGWRGEADQRGLPSNRSRYFVTASRNRVDNN